MRYPAQHPHPTGMELGSFWFSHPFPGLTEQLAQPEDRATGIQRVRMAAQVGNQSRFILLLAASPQDTGAADMGLQ